MIFCYIFMLVAPYLICGVNSAIIVTKIKSGQDIRTLGSGGAGLTNALRTQGKTAAAFVLLGDVLKGIIAVFLVRLVFFLIGGVNTSDFGGGLNWVAYAAGVAACLGHVFPVYYGFKGGKGILVTVAVLYGIDWISASILLGIFFVIVAITRYVSVGSIIAAFLYPFCTLIMSLLRADASAWGNFACASLIGAILIFMHRANMKRLRSGTENKLSFGKAKNEN